MNRKFKEKSSSLMILISSIGIILLLNIISLKLFFRLDFTENKSYTLSKVSKELMQGLDDVLIVKAYFSKNLPHPYSNNARYLKDKLDEFKAYSKGNLKYEFIDPEDDENLKRELAMSGIPTIQLTSINRDKFEIKKGYMGLIVLFEDRKGVIPVIKSTVGLEYDIITTIKKVMHKEVKKIGFLSGHGEPSLTKGLESITNYLRQQYDITEVNIKDGKTISDSIHSLVIIGPKEKVSAREKYEIDQFLMKGKSIAFLIDKVETDFKDFSTTPVENDLDDLLEYYGAKINSDLILDPSNRRIRFSQRRGTMLINNTVDYPLFPIFKDLNRENPIVSKLEAVFLPFASSIKLLSRGEKITLTPLIKSSDRSWRQTKEFVTSPLQKFRFDPSNKGPFVAAAVLKGEFKSFYAGKEIPEMEQKETTEPGVAIEDTDKDRSTIPVSPVTRILVVGDSDFIKSDIPLDKRNIPFILNLIDWLAQDEALISIRSREITDRPLKEISTFKRKMVKFSNIFAIPILLIIFGLIKWKIRQLRKREVWE